MIAQFWGEMTPRSRKCFCTTFAHFSWILTTKQAVRAINVSSLGRGAKYLFGCRNSTKTKHFSRNHVCNDFMSQCTAKGHSVLLQWCFSQVSLEAPKMLFEKVFLKPHNWLWFKPICPVKGALVHSTNQGQVCRISPAWHFCLQKKSPVAYPKAAVMRLSCWGAGRWGGFHSNGGDSRFQTALSQFVPPCPFFPAFLGGFPSCFQRSFWFALSSHSLCL